MPFKSQAQRRFMFAAESRGDLPKGTAKRWAKHTPDIKDLPERKSDDDKKAEKKALFIKGFKERFFKELGLDKSAAATPCRLDLLEKIAEAGEGMLKCAAKQPPGEVPFFPGLKGHPDVHVVVDPKTGVTHFGIAGSATEKIVGEGGLSNLGMAVGAPFVLGGLAGAGLARLVGPSNEDIGNLQKQEVLTQYDNAINELKRRISIRGA